MNDLPPDSTASRFKLTPLYWTGLKLFACACGPYLLFNLAGGSGMFDRASHSRLGFWLLVPALLGFGPSMICMAWGIGQSVLLHFRSRDAVIAPQSQPSPASGPPLFKLGKLFWIGLIVFLGCSGPLITIMLAAKLGLTSDPNPNPVLLGAMAGLTFWPSIGCMVGGVIQSGISYSKAKKLYEETRR